MENKVINFTLHSKFSGTNLELRLVSQGIHLKEEQIYHKIIDLEESLIRESLIKLGWTPPQVKEEHG